MITRFATLGYGRKYELNMSSTPMEKIAESDCVVIVTDYSQYDYVEDRGEWQARPRFTKCNKGDRSLECRAMLTDGSRLSSAKSTQD
jgi:hypothetical protein